MMTIITLWWYLQSVAVMREEALHFFFHLQVVPVFTLLLFFNLFLLFFIYFLFYFIFKPETLY